MRKWMLATLFWLMPVLGAAQAVLVPSPIPSCSDGQYLQWSAGPAAFICATPSISSITVADTTSATTWVGLFEAATGSQTPKTDAALTYNATTGMLSATGFTGPLTGNASTATSATSAASATTATNATNTAITDDTTTAATMYPTWVTAVTGNVPQKASSTKLTFTPSTGVLTATGFSGALTGNVTGNVSGTAGSATGNAATATALAADPGDCGANTWATTINASGTLGCAAVTYAGVTAMSSANFAGLIDDETGTGLVALATSPAFLGTPTFGNGATSAGSITIKEDSDDGTNTVKLQAQAMAANLTFTLPAVDGSPNQVLITNGSGVWSWTDNGAGAGANAALSNLVSVALNTALLPDAAAADDFGSATLPFKDLWFAGSSGTPGTNNFKITGASTSGTRVATFPNKSGTVAMTSDISSSAYTVVSVTSAGSPYTASASELIICDTTEGSITVNLPAVAANAGRTIVIKKTIAANSAVLDGASSETIDGALTYTFTVQYASITLVCDGAVWHII